MVAAGGLSLASAGIARADTQPGRWSRLESANFVIHSSSDEIYSRSELVALEGFHGLLTRLMPPRSKSALKLNIYMAGNEADFDDAWPGVGRLAVQSVFVRDYPVVQAGVFVLALTFVAINLLVDLLYGVLDPRIRRE